MTREPLITRWDREPGYALRYRDRRFTEASGARTDRRERAALCRLLRGLEIGAGPWLDVPSGAGRMSELLPGPVVQVDLDPAMLQAAPGERPRARARAHALPFADDSFAGALCHRLIHHLPGSDERVQVLAELARVSRGPVVFSFFHATSLQHARRLIRRRTGKPRSGRGAVRLRTLLRDLERAGLRLEAAAPLLPFLSEQWLVRCRRVMQPDIPATAPLTSR